MPTRHAPVLGRLGKLDNAKFERLSQLINDTGTPASLRNIQTSITDVLEAASSEGHRLLAALMSLYTVGHDHGWSVNDIAETVSKSDSIELLDEERVDLEHRLEGLLSSEVVASLSKASELAHEYSNQFHTARLLTDVRPIFQADPSVNPNAVVISQILRLEYFDNSNATRHGVEMLLDETDIAHLVDVCQRALAKSNTLKAMTSQLGLISIDTEASH